MKVLYYIVIFLLVHSCQGWGSSNPGKVLLRDVQVLTLKQGQMTTGRRSSPVPQLTCVGGSAQGQFNPQVVQCYNRGFDGQDVQWECKADMDNLYRFGQVEVVCEGYEYADDPYILQGSCGLEYTLELTKEGHQRSQRSSDQGSSYHSSYGSNSYNSYKSNKSSGFGDLVVMIAIGLVVYALYKTCIDTNSGRQAMGDRQFSSTNNDYPGGSPGGGGWFSGGGGNNGQGHNNYGGVDPGACGGGQAGRGGTGGHGGFWSGLGMGGLLGYMLGGNRGYGGYNRGWGGYNRGYYNQGGWGGSGFGTTTGGWGGGSSTSFGSTSSGTRTASGFGGTRRR